MDMTDCSSALGTDRSPTAALLCGELPIVRVEDAFIAARVSKEAKRIGCNESNVRAAIAWALQMPVCDAVIAGINRAHQLLKRQRPTNPTPTPPSRAA